MPARFENQLLRIVRGLFQVFPAKSVERNIRLLREAKEEELGEILQQARAEWEEGVRRGILPMIAKRAITPIDFRQAVVGSWGNPEEIARRLDVDLQDVEQFLAQHPELNEVLRAERMRIIYKAFEVAKDALDKGDGIMARYLLSSQLAQGIGLSAQQTGQKQEQITVRITYDDKQKKTIEGDIVEGEIEGGEEDARIPDHFAEAPSGAEDNIGAPGQTEGH